MIYLYIVLGIIIFYIIPVIISYKMIKNMYKPGGSFDNSYPNISDILECILPLVNILFILVEKGLNYNASKFFNLKNKDNE